MEGSAISATVGVLVQNLIDVSKDEISLIRGLNENVNKLRGTLGMIQSFLDDAETKSVTEPAVKTWLKELEAKAFEADNALDEVNYQLLYEKVSSCFPSFYLCVHRRDVALRINEINTSFESINKTATELGLREKLAAAPAAADAASAETDSVTVDPIFIGRDDDVSRIVEMLTKTKEAVSILPIVGMGGLGKTTLTRNVFNHKKIETHFGKRIWVHVSRDFDAVALLKKILRNVKGGKVEGESREDLLKKLKEAEKAQNDEEVHLLKKKLTDLEEQKYEGESREVVVKKIQEALKGKTYLLVLDDVWNEDEHKWEDFIRCWSGITSTNGNGILVTTRSAGVGALVKTLDMHLLNYLSDEECWSIIKGRALEGGVITQDLEDIGIRIAKKCRGLPLAANVVGGALRGKSQDEWRLINESWLLDVEGDENYISKILKYSFHNLPSPYLKKCFAYCSVFPKGARIDREQLIQFWMAEGFLQPSHTSDMEIVGNQFLKVLLHNSLLQVVDRDEYGDVKHCSMHDLVHDVASSISYGIYYKRDESSQISKEQAKWHFCLGCNGDESSRIPKEQARLLRTLFYNGKISDIMFSDFISLHSLTLTNHEVKVLPDSIRELIHLRCLDISDTRIRYLPNSIGKLSHLQTIRTNSSRNYYLEKLPITLKHLLKLRHLYIHRWTDLPPQLGLLTSLQTLSCFQVRNKEGHRIVELESLKNLKWELRIDNLENVQGEEESKKAYLSQKSGITRLVLNWSPSRKGVRINDENVLKGVEPHPNLKKLEIEGFSGANFPRWTSKMAVFLEGRWVGLSSLMEITLADCGNFEKMPMLGHLPHLKSLCLRNLKNVKCIGASLYGIEECNAVYKETISVFPALERLELLWMERLIEWEEVKVPSVKVFPCLEYLKIYGCKELRSAPSQFTTLKEVIVEYVDSELPLASICGAKLKTLTKLSISRIEGMIRLPSLLFHNNQHLSELTIHHCKELIELADGMHNLNSLEQLTVQDCPKLKELPDGMHNLINSLEQLNLLGCYDLKAISGGKLQGLASLRRLGISALLNFFEDSAPSLEELSIDVSLGSEGWDSASLNKAADGILRLPSHTLRKLELSGNAGCVSLPNQLQHLTALSHLALSDLGMEELPEWFGNLSSLQELKLEYCLKLKRLPSVEAMRRLTNLTTLQIKFCPLLLKRRCIKRQREWHKISHLPNIMVDGKDIRKNGPKSAAY